MNNVYKKEKRELLEYIEANRYMEKISNRAADILVDFLNTSEDLSTTSDLLEAVLEDGDRALRAPRELSKDLEDVANILMMQEPDVPIIEKYINEVISKLDNFKIVEYKVYTVQANYKDPQIKKSAWRRILNKTNHVVLTLENGDNTLDIGYNKGLRSASVSRNGGKTIRWVNFEAAGVDQDKQELKNLISRFLRLSVEG